MAPADPSRREAVSIPNVVAHDVELREPIRVRLRPSWVEIIYLSGIAFADVYIWFAAFRMQTISGAWVAYLLLMCTMFGVSFLFFIRSMLQDGRIAVESNWGGLGGGIGGWRLSSSLVFLLTSAALFTALLFGVQAAQVPTLPDLRERYRAAINLGEREQMQFDSIQLAGGKLKLT